MTKPRLAKVRALFYVLQQVTKRGCAILTQPILLVISLICSNLEVSNNKYCIMITESKVTEIFCIADDFCKEFEVEMAKNSLPSSPEPRNAAGSV